MTTTVAAVDIIKSPVDDKNYRYFELDNKLKVLLIEDSTTELSAASLDVNVGSSSNPEQWLGLAHFLEHMLFLGSEKYPNVGEYSEFIENHGGSRNAYTAPTNTNYFFSISNNKFEQALDRFSRFFIDPTFDPKYVDRERHVVHSEYQARRTSDSMQIYAARKELFNSQHPHSNFTVGSLQTLADKSNQSVRDALIDFYNQYYSANLMSLVVVSNKSLDTLEKWVRQSFAEIPNHNVDRPIFPSPLIANDDKKRLLLVKPRSELYLVEYHFLIPSVYAEYKTKPASIIASLIGDESAGSLTALLRQLGYATGLNSGVSFSDPVQSLFTIHIDLTDKGAANIEQVNQLVFEKIRLSRENLDPWRYQEAKKLADINFRFKQEGSSIRLASRLASALHKVEPQDVLRSPYMFHQFDAKRTSELMQHLRPDNVSIMFVAPDVKTDSVVEYYETPVSLVEPPQQQVEQWSVSEINPKLESPQPNQFIPERLQVFDVKDTDNAPVKLVQQEPIDVWYLQDNEFASPRASVFMTVMSPVVQDNLHDHVLFQHWLKLVRHRLEDATYHALLASLNYDIYAHLRGFTVHIEGFEDKQSELLKLILKAISEIEFTQAEFDTYKNVLIRSWRNSNKDSPQQQLLREFSRYMLKPSWSDSQKIAALEKTTRQDLQNWHERYFQNVFVRMMAHGDVSQDSVAEHVSLINDTLNKSQFIEALSFPDVKQLNQRGAVINSVEIDDHNNALMLYYQGEDTSLNEQAKTLLLSNLMSTEYYNSLRTEHRVGYIVYATAYNIIEQPGLLFFAQSESHTPEKLLDLTADFFVHYRSEFKATSVEMFTQVKSSLVASLKEPDKNLKQRSKRLWKNLNLPETDFSYEEKLIEAINQVSLEQVQAFYEKLILDNRAKLIMQSLGNNEDKKGLIEYNQVDAMQQTINDSEY